MRHVTYSDVAQANSGSHQSQRKRHVFRVPVVAIEIVPAEIRQCSPSAEGSIQGAKCPSCAFFAQGWALPKSLMLSSCAELEGSDPSGQPAIADGVRAKTQSQNGGRR